jgi:amino acid transporter
MKIEKNPNKKLGVFKICMFSIIAVDSIRTLPISAEYGAPLVSFYILAGILFLLPCAFVSAELASTWPEDGGLYIWIRNAFGKKFGFMSAWLLWVYNIIWFPTLVAFICATAGAAFMPNIMQHKIILLSAMLAMFWTVTLINYFGIKWSSLMSTLGVLIGTLLPMIIIIALGIYWFSSNKPMAITITLKSLLPNLNSMHNLGLLTGVLFGLMGIEVSSSFAGDVENPQKNFPRAMFISAAIILATLIFGSLTVAMIVPVTELNLATGVVQAFQIILDKLHMLALLDWVVFFIFIGSLGGLSTWMAGPSKNMMIAAQDDAAPKFASKTNRFGAASNMLFTQAIVFTILCSIYMIFPKFNSAYLLLSNISSQLAIIVYLLLFSAAIKLRYSKPEVPRPFKVPGGMTGMWLIAGIAFISMVAVFIMGFLPPASMAIVKIKLYETMLMGGVAIVIALGLIIAATNNKQK